MRFGNPPLLTVTLVTVLVLAGFLYWAWRKRLNDITLFVRSRLLANLTVGVSATRRKIRLVLITLAVGCVLLALARPQWGFTLEELKQQGLDIIVAIDTSRSMLAEDTAPNRLARAKLAALELMPLAKTDRLGLVAFAGTAFLQCPLTMDEDAFRQSLNLLNVGIIPQGGTALAEAINTALAVYKLEQENVKVLILITDGEDHDSGAVAAAEIAAKADLRIFTIGVGTSQGELLRQKDEKGQTSFIKDDEGNVVKSRLNESLLRQIAETASGFYLPLHGADTMDILYERGLAPLLGLTKDTLLSRSGKRPPSLIRRFQERFQWPLGLAVLLLLAEMFLPDRKLVRRTQKPASQPASPVFHKVTVALLLGCLVISVQASPTTAMRLYESGRYPAALREYQRLAKRNPNDARLAFNAGAAAYQVKQYDTAVDHFNQALTSLEVSLQQRAYYNLGNTRYRLGEAAEDTAQKVQEWQQAIEHYESALKLNPQDADAEFNLELVKKKLQELQQQQAQQQKQDQSNQDKSQSEPSSEKKSPQPQESGQSQDNQQSAAQKPEGQKDQAKKDQEAKADKQASQEQEASQGQSSAQPRKQPGDTNQTDTAQASIKPGQMTLEQALRLLQAQKDQEKFFMEKAPRQPLNRRFKDW